MAFNSEAEQAAALEAAYRQINKLARELAALHLQLEATESPPFTRRRLATERDHAIETAELALLEAEEARATSASLQTQLFEALEDAGRLRATTDAHARTMNLAALLDVVEAAQVVLDALDGKRTEYGTYVRRYDILRAALARVGTK